jgi:hypothetical protein
MQTWFLGKHTMSIQFCLKTRCDTAATGLSPPPRNAPASPTMGPLPWVLHHIRRPFPPPPLFIPWIKPHLNLSHFIPINAGHFSVLITSRHPPPQPLYKGRAPLFSTAPLPALLLFSPCPSTARTECLLRRFFTAIDRPPHYHQRPGEARGGLPVHPSPRCATSGKLPCPGAATRPSSGVPPCNTYFLQE